MKDILIEIRTGSDSDIPKIKSIYEILDLLEVPYQKRILSAHRTPMAMITEAQNLKKNGFKVSVAAAGGSAHLAGMTASETVLPVVALPVKTSLGDGLDSLLSMIQMPPGIPNACVGIDDGKSAGILATRMAYFYDRDIRKKIAKLENKKIQDEGNIQNNPIKKINIISENFKNSDFSLLGKMGINYEINQKINSFIPVLYVDDFLDINKSLNNNIEHVSVLCPMVSNDNSEKFNFSEFTKNVKSSVGNAGVNRLNNGLLLMAQILGNYFPEVAENFQNYRDDLARIVKEKDSKIK